MILEPLTIPGRPEMLSQLMDYVAWAATAVGLGEQGIYRLSLAVDEIATNIVIHGYAEAERQGELTIWAGAEGDKLTVFLEDTGRPFDPRQVPQPDNLDRPLEERCLLYTSASSSPAPTPPFARRFPTCWSWASTLWS